MISSLPCGGLGSGLTGAFYGPELIPHSGPFFFAEAVKKFSLKTGSYGLLQIMRG